MVLPSLIAVAAAMLLVRRGWGGPRVVAVVGWALAAAALLVLTAAEGAWGLAVGTVAAMTVAIAAVLHAGWTAPGRALRPPREAPSVTLPKRPREVARRCLVFLLVVPVAFVAAQGFAFGVQALARAHGAGEGDATALILFLQPLVWAVLMAWQMTRAGPARMVAAPTGTAAVGVLLWSMA